MLPFKKKDEAAMSGPVDAIKREPDHEVDFDAMESASEDLLRAIEAKDTRAMTIALRAAFELCDTLPHAEGAHLQDGEG